MSNVNMKFFNNDEGVSPIVATLVLIVVAIVGAAAVGLIMGSFSSQVSDQANTGDVAGTASNSILIAGSTTVQPASEILAKAYMKDHQGVKITVQGGGSGAGVSSVGMGIVDIGSASRSVKTTEQASYPDLKEYQIGGSGVVIIMSAASTPTDITAAQAKALYDADASTAGPAGVSKVVYRSESSGTSDTFMDWAWASTGVPTQIAPVANTAPATTVVGAIGNAGVLAEVQKVGAGTIGYVDYGYAKGASNIVILTADGLAAGTNGANILAELKNKNGVAYPTKLTRPLNYITNGEPSSIVKDYITFCQSPGSIQYMNQAGMFGLAEFA